MSQSVTVTRSIKDGDTTLTASEVVTSGRLTKLSEAIPKASTAMLVASVVDVSELEAIHIHSDVALTVYTNSANGAGGDTIALVAGQAIHWTSSDPVGMRPLSLDVTAIYVTEANVAAGTLTMWTLTDPTPA